VDEGWLQKQLGRIGVEELPPPPQPEKHGGWFSHVTGGLVGKVAHKLGSIAHAGGNVIHTTTHFIEHRLIPFGLLNKIPGHRGDVSSHAMAAKTFPSEDAAKAAYAQAARQLVDPNQWGSMLAKPPAPPQRFELYDKDGQMVHRPAQQGDYVKIIPLIPLPGEDPEAPVSANWVHIDEATVGPDRAELVVRPSKDPTGENPAPVAHVFDSRATNTFSVERDGTSLRSAVHGEHEYANSGSHAGGFTNKIRNRLAAEALWGNHLHFDFLGFHGTASPQQALWDSFTSHLVDQQVGTRV
jgi:hypothetical protein